MGAWRAGPDLLDPSRVDGAGQRVKSAGREARRVRGARHVTVASHTGVAARGSTHGTLRETERKCGTSDSTNTA